MLTMVAMAWAQVEPFPCKPDPALTAGIAGFEVQRITGFDADYVLSAATSLLAPPKGREPDARAFPEYHELVAAHDAWTCTYGPTRLVDRDETTAWCEGAPGPGIGEIVVVALPAGPVRVRAGYGKTAQLYAQNARPRRIEVVLLGPGFPPPVQFEVRVGLPVLGRHEVELADLDGWQPLPLPATTAADPRWIRAGPPGQGPPAPEPPAFVAIRILSVWPGSKYEDTCLTEIGG